MSRGRSLNIRWGARWRPELDHPTKLRLIPGSYEGFDGLTYEYFEYIEFWSQRAKRNFISSKEWKIVNGDLQAVGGDCIGYDEWLRESKAGLTKNTGATISLRHMRVFNGIHLEWYHWVPVFDENDKPVVYKNGERKGEQIVEKQICTGRRCQLCKDKYEKVFGKKIHWSLSPMHFNALCGYVQAIEKDCGNCGGRGTLSRVGFECAKCSAVLRDLTRDDLSVQDEEKFASSTHTCPKCGHVDLPVDIIDCSECNDPEKQSVFGVDLAIQRHGENTQSTIQILGWNHTRMSESLEEMAKPWPFREIFSPDPFEFQAKALKVQNTYGNADAEGEARDYGDTSSEDIPY